jgi:hypothetical protein
MVIRRTKPPRLLSGWLGAGCEGGGRRRPGRRSRVGCRAHRIRSRTAGRRRERCRPAPPCCRHGARRRCHRRLDGHPAIVPLGETAIRLERSPGSRRTGPQSGPSQPTAAPLSWQQYSTAAAQRPTNARRGSPRNGCPSVTATQDDPSPNYVGSSIGSRPCIGGTQGSLYRSTFHPLTSLPGGIALAAVGGDAGSTGDPTALVFVPGGRADVSDLGWTVSGCCRSQLVRSLVVQAIMLDVRVSGSVSLLQQCERGMNPIRRCRDVSLRQSFGQDRRWLSTGRARRYRESP